ncbi:MAG: hypothetical protein L3J66_07150 [Bacteroidales bacterium]|nr:hypothetical protein [Bacteroidales bacterium]
MKTLKFLALFTSIFSLVIVSSCKKDDDTDPNKDAPNYKVKTVQVPDAMVQSSDPGAQQAASYINMVNGMAGYGSMMTPPSKRTSVTNFKDGGGDVYVWEINDGNTHCTFTLKVSESVTTYYWEMIIDGILEGQAFNNFTYLKAEEAKDGSSSSFTVYDPETGGILMTMSWYDNGSVTNFTFEIPNEVLMAVNVNADGSGFVEVKSWQNGQYVLDFRAEWDASGHGQWWAYDGGVVIDQGSW